MSLRNCVIPLNSRPRSFPSGIEGADRVARGEMLDGAIVTGQPRTMHGSTAFGRKLRMINAILSVLPLLVDSEILAVAVTDETPEGLIDELVARGASSQHLARRLRVAKVHSQTDVVSFVDRVSSDSTRVAVLMVTEYGTIGPICASVLSGLADGRLLETAELVEPGAGAPISRAKVRPMAVLVSHQNDRSAGVPGIVITPVVAPRVVAPRTAEQVF